MICFFRVPADFFGGFETKNSGIQTQKGVPRKGVRKESAASFCIKRCQGSDPFYWMRVILASNRGTLMEQLRWQKGRGFFFGGFGVSSASFCDPFVQNESVPPTCLCWWKFIMILQIYVRTCRLGNTNNFRHSGNGSFHADTNVPVRSKLESLRLGISPIITSGMAPWIFWVSRGNSFHIFFSWSFFLFEEKVPRWRELWTCLKLADF